jgi:hypothetical protein
MDALPLMRSQGTNKAGYDRQQAHRCRPYTATAGAAPTQAALTLQGRPLDRHIFVKTLRRRSGDSPRKPETLSEDRADRIAEADGRTHPPGVHTLNSAIPQQFPAAFGMISLPPQPLEEHNLLIPATATALTCGGLHKREKSQSDSERFPLKWWKTLDFSLTYPLN